MTLMVGLIASNVLDLAADGVRVVGDGAPGPAHAVAARDPGVRLGPGASWRGLRSRSSGLAEGLSAARLYATEDARVDASQELLAVGVGNVSSGIFGGFGVAGSLSKTATVDRAGGRSQVAGLTTAFLALATILFLAPLLSALPKATLSAIVIHAVWGLLDFKSMRRYAFLRRNDIVAATVAAIGVLVFGPLQGLLLAIALSVFGLVYRSSRVDVEVMGRIPGEKAGWGGMRNHPERHPVKGILVLRVDVPLFWVNSASIKDAILARVDGAREFVDDEIVAVVLDIEGTNQIDTTTVDMLESLLAALRVRCVDLYLVRVMYPVRVILRRAGFVAKIGEDHMWHTISQGVREARIHYGLKEGVVDASGGYDSAAEEHEPRIVPTYFTDARQYAEAATADGGDGDDDEGVTVETPSPTASRTTMNRPPSRFWLRRVAWIPRRGDDEGPRRADAERSGRVPQEAREDAQERQGAQGLTRALAGCPVRRVTPAAHRLGRTSPVVLRWSPVRGAGARTPVRTSSGVPLVLPAVSTAPVAIDVPRPLHPAPCRSRDPWAGLGR